MPRVGFVMNIKSGAEDEYKKRHNEIWPELVELLKEHGLNNYSIYRQNLTLFAYVEVENPVGMLELAQNELMKKWWAYMEPLMECNPDKSPKIDILEEVFHLD